MKSNRQKIGIWGESLAAEKLIANGYVIEDRNYRTPYGELDLIARKEDLLIFIEVKARTNGAFGMPEDSITKRKREHILQSIDYYLQERPDLVCDWRVDVIAIRGRPGLDNPEIVWFENALA
jgi:putative endonuclease